MSSSLCEHCLKYLDRSTFIDAIAKPDIPATASLTLTKKISSVGEICKVILSKAQDFEDNSPEISMEFILGPEMHDIKRVRLIYRGPVSGDEDFATGFDQVLRSYIVHALPGMLTLRPHGQNLRQVPQTIQQLVSSRQGLSK